MMMEAGVPTFHADASAMSTTLRSMKKSVSFPTETQDLTTVHAIPSCFHVDNNIKKTQLWYIAADIRSIKKRAREISQNWTLIWNPRTIETVLGESLRGLEYVSPQEESMLFLRRSKAVANMVWSASNAESQYSDEGRERDDTSSHDDDSLKEFQTNQSPQTNHPSEENNYGQELQTTPPTNGTLSKFYARAYHRGSETAAQRAVERARQDKMYVDDHIRQGDDIVKYTERDATITISTKDNSLDQPLASITTTTTSKRPLDLLSNISGGIIILLGKATKKMRILPSRPRSSPFIRRHLSILGRKKQSLVMEQRETPTSPKTAASSDILV